MVGRKLRKKRAGMRLSGQQLDLTGLDRRIAGFVLTDLCADQGQRKCGGLACCPKPGAKEVESISGEPSHSRIAPLEKPGMGAVDLRKVLPGHQKIAELSVRYCMVIEILRCVSLVVSGVTSCGQTNVLDQNGVTAKCFLRLVCNFDLKDPACAAGRKPTMT